MRIKFRSEIGKLLKDLNLLDKAAEIGVAEGRFSSEILSWGVSKLYLVDIWYHDEDMKGCANFPQDWHNENLISVKEIAKDSRVVILKGYSNEMSNQVDDDSLSFIYVDGDHLYEGVKSDLVHWFPKLKCGGVIAFHDYLAPEYGVQRAVKEFVNDRFKIVIIPELSIENTGAYFIKTC